MNTLMKRATQGHKHGRFDRSPALIQHRLQNEPCVVNDRAQAQLTERYLLPALADLEAFFLTLRNNIDLMLRQNCPVKLGKPYPIGQCLEITLAVQQHLRDAGEAMLQSVAAIRGYQAYTSFRKAGGTTRQVWGDLRGEFFQNAFQVGTLYVDVANDSVTPTKPKVEILPFVEAKLTPITDFRHFSRIATVYWKVQIYPNHVLPEWSPSCPLVCIGPNGNVIIAEATYYMVTLTQRTAFKASEDVLRDDAMPAEMFAYVAKHLAGTKGKLPHSAEEGRKAALQACRKQRAKRWHQSRQRADESIIAVIEINRRLAQASPFTSLQPGNRYTEPNMNDESKVTIDGIDYQLSKLSDGAKTQLTNLSVVDQEIARIQRQLAIAQTARNAYANALKEELPKDG